MPEFTVLDPLICSNLAVYLVQPSTRKRRAPSKGLPAYSPLGAAHVSRGVVVINESDDLEEIQIENASGGDLFIQAGQVLRGGCYDRIVAEDMILPAPKVLPAFTPLPVFSVEESDREQRLRIKTFSDSDWLAPTLRLKLALRSGEQEKIWKAVAEAEQSIWELMEYSSSSISRQSVWRMLNYPDVHHRFKAPYTQFQILDSAHSQAMGAVMAFNGRIAYADLYCSQRLFQQTWQQLLFTAAAEEMMTRAGSSNVPMSGEHPTKEEVAEWLAGARNASATRRRKKSNERVTVEIRTSNGTVSFSTLDDARDALCVHESILATS